MWPDSIKVTELQPNRPPWEWLTAPTNQLRLYLPSKISSGRKAPRKCQKFVPRHACACADALPPSPHGPASSNSMTSCHTFATDNVGDRLLITESLRNRISARMEPRNGTCKLYAQVRQNPHADRDAAERFGQRECRTSSPPQDIPRI
jgi:hypothetical protein